MAESPMVLETIFSMSGGNPLPPVVIHLEKQELFGGLRFPPDAGPGSTSREGLAALAGLVKHLRRLHADGELATPNQMVCCSAMRNMLVHSYNSLA